MAKNEQAQAMPGNIVRIPTGTVEVPAEVFQQMQARLESLEQMTRVNTESLLNSRTRVIDNQYEAWKREMSRPISERTQELADKKYTGGLRFRVRMDSTREDGKPGPNTSEFYPLNVSAHSDLEAKARYEEIMGITRTEHRIVAEPVTV